MKIKEYIKAESLEQAYQLNQKKTSRIVGGMLWMKMSKANIQTAIDLSGLGLDTIEETEEEYQIGCMVTLRQLEQHEGLNQMTQNAVKKSVSDIVGVQFRNLATVGGSIFGRFGFSDVLTMFLALDTEVELYKRGRVPLSIFAAETKDNDILVRLIVKKEEKAFAYQTVRNTKTDFPVLACAVCDGEDARAIVGARPGRAVVRCFTSEEKEAFTACTDPTERIELYKRIAERISEETETGSNVRGSAAYRHHLIKVLVRRCLEEIDCYKSVKTQE